MKVLLLILVLAVGASAQARSDFLKPQPLPPDIWRANGPMTVLFTSVCVGGQGSDVISSTGYEGNSFLRGADGRMNRWKAAPLKLSMCIAPLLWEKKASRTVRIFTRVAQLGIGMVGFYDAAHNWKVNHR